MNRIDCIRNVPADDEGQPPGEIPIVAFKDAIRAILHGKSPEEAWCRREVVHEDQAEGRSVCVGDGPAVMTEREAWKKYFEIPTSHRSPIACQLAQQLEDITGRKYRVEHPF